MEMTKEAENLLDKYTKVKPPSILASSKDIISTATKIAKLNQHDTIVGYDMSEALMYGGNIKMLIRNFINDWDVLEMTRQQADKVIGGEYLARVKKVFGQDISKAIAFLLQETEWNTKNRTPNKRREAMIRLEKKALKLII